ncbi:MAG: SAM-dependent DNA methyltransferase, partial [Acidithiobacillus ferrivorans]
MKHKPRHHPAFATLRLEGGLFLPDQLEKAALGAARFQSEADYRTPKSLKLKDDTSRAFQIASAQWKHFAGQFERSDVDVGALTRHFVQELLRDVFGYTHIAPATGLSVGDQHYPVTFLAGALPVVIALHSLGLDAADPGFAVTGNGARKKAAFQLAQEFLNASPDHTWAMVSNGRQLRLLRDAATLTRPSFLEIDLQDLLGGARYAEFANVWRLLHASRAPQPALHPESGEQEVPCIWEQWRAAGQEEGTRVREGLRQGVTEALLIFGEGFIQHPANEALRGAMAVAVSSARSAYAEGYAVARLRDLCLKRRARNRFDDHWQALRIVFK